MNVLNIIIPMIKLYQKAATLAQLGKSVVVSLSSGGLSSISTAPASWKLRVVEELCCGNFLQPIAPALGLNLLTLLPRVAMSGERVERVRGRREVAGLGEIEPLSVNPEPNQTVEVSEPSGTPIGDPSEVTMRRARHGSRRRRARLRAEPVENHPEPELGSQASLSPSAESSGSVFESPQGLPNLEERIQRRIEGALEEKLEIQLTRVAEMIAALRVETVAHPTSTVEAPVLSHQEGPREPIAAAGGAGGDGDGESDFSGSRDESGHPRSFRDSGIPHREAGKASGGRRDSVENLASVLAGSELAKLWGTGDALPGPRGGVSAQWPKQEPALMLLKPPEGTQFTARHFLDFCKKHVIMLSQNYYPLLMYIEKAMRAYIETFYKEDNLKFLPEDMQTKGVVSLASLDNRQLIDASQLCIRPTSRDKYLERLRDCPCPRPPAVEDDFMSQSAHYNYNMALLNQIEENIDFLNLNGGIRHMPPLDFSVDADRVNAQGNKLAIGLVRVISEMLSGTLATKLIINFRPRTAAEESESPLPPPPNYGKHNQPRTVSELFAAIRAIYRHYFRSWEAIKSLKEDYDGNKGYSVKQNSGIQIELERTVRKRETALNSIQTFADRVEEIVKNAEEENVDGLLEEALDEQIELLQAMSSMGVCYSALFSPTGECRKKLCTYNHERVNQKFAIIEQLIKIMKTNGYQDAFETGLLMEPIKLKPDWDKAAPPAEARATKPMRSYVPGVRGVLPKPDTTPESQVPFRTPQANRYATTSKTHKLHTISQSTEESSRDEEPIIPEATDDAEESQPATPEEIDEVEEFYSELLKEVEIQRDGTRLYRLSSVDITDMPKVTVSLHCPYGDKTMEVKVEAALDTCATSSYIANGITDLLRPLVDPRAFRAVRSCVKLGAPPDYVSTEQVVLKMLWLKDDIQQETLDRFVILNTENIQVILGLKTILFGGFIDPLFKILHEMKERYASNHALMAVRDCEETNYLCMAKELVPKKPQRERERDPLHGPVRVLPSNLRNGPQTDQTIDRISFPVIADPVGERWRTLCPMANMSPTEVNSAAHLIRAHYEELARYLRGDQYSAAPTYTPFYWQDTSGHVHEEPTTPPYCMMNVNGRYNVYNGVYIWQWGIFYGSGSGVHMEHLNSFYEVMQRISPKLDQRPELPFAAKRLKDYMELGYKEKRARRIEELDPNKRSREKTYPVFTRERQALQDECNKEAEPAIRKMRAERRERERKDKLAKRKQQKAKKRELEEPQEPHNPRDSGWVTLRSELDEVDEAVTEVVGSWIQTSHHESGDSSSSLTEAEKRNIKEFMAQLVSANDSSAITESTDESGKHDQEEELSKGHSEEEPNYIVGGST